MDTVERRGVLCISLDFELFWGLRDHARLQDLQPRLLGARQAVLRMLDLFAEYEVQATWATVGLLLCQDKDEMLQSLPRTRPRYANPALSPYDALDAVGRDEGEDPFHFAPSLVERIRRTPGQEVGCHTFGHYYCHEPGHSLDAFEADLDAAMAVAARRGLSLTSLVLPRNQVDPACLPACAARGILCYRGLGNFFAEQGRSPRNRALRLLNAHLPLSGSMAWPLEQAVSPTGTAAPLNIRASHFVRPPSSRLAPVRPLHLRRLLRDMEHAARTGRVLHLWWHPHNFGLHLEQCMGELRRLLARFAALREERGMRSLHMSGLAGLAAASPGQGRGREDL